MTDLPLLRLRDNLRFNCLLPVPALTIVALPANDVPPLNPAEVLPTCWNFLPFPPGSFLKNSICSDNANSNLAMTILFT
uniref:Uncharacterized protein n=1 Tax=uncultured marine virus TaxID=186617 RepID=A0A0F7L9H6_9VIRU|nr:hypothetical protein [uncultured marine virus]